MSKRFGLLLIFALIAGGAVFYQVARPPAAVSAAFEGEPQLIAATFSSEWCASCRVLKPKLAEALPEFSGRPVRFVEYDFTFGARDDMRAEAEADGLGEIYERFQGATGFTVLVDAGTGEIIDTLTMNHSAKAMAAAIEDALAIAAARASVPHKDS